MIKKNSAILKIIVIIFIITIILKLCLVFLWPFVLSIMLIIFIEPLIKYFIKIGFKRKSACIISYIIFVLFLILMIFVISNYAYNQIIDLFEKLSYVIEHLSYNIQLKNININYKQIIESIENILLSYKSKIFKTIISTINGLLYLFIILTTSFFVSLDIEIITKKSRQIIPIDIFITIEKIINKISKVITSEIKLVLITTIQTIVGFYILGANNALTIGIICGILDILPIVGPALIFLPWIVYEIIIKNMAFAIGLILLYILLQIVRQILNIKFVGNNLKLHPVATIFSLYVGILIFGVWGVIFGPFMVIVIQELFNKYNEGRLRMYL